MLKCYPFTSLMAKVSRRFPSLCTRELGIECVISKHLHPENDIKICIVGFGRMGRLIAAELLRRGCIVRVYDANRRKLKSAHKTIVAMLASSTYFSQHEKNTILRRFSVADSIEELFNDGCHVAFEAASEQLKVKQQIFRDMSAALVQNGESPCKVVLCSNTMCLPISLIAAHVNEVHTRRCVALRFLCPVLFVDEVVVKCEHAELALHSALLEPLHLKERSLAPPLFVDDVHALIQ